MKRKQPRFVAAFNLPAVQSQLVESITIAKIQLGCIITSLSSSYRYHIFVLYTDVIASPVTPGRSSSCTR